MTLLAILKQNFSSISHYDEIIKKPLSFSFRVFLAFFIVFGLIATILLSIRLIPITKEKITESLNNALKIYPEELVLKIEKGHVSTNVKEPYYVRAVELEKIFEKEAAKTIANQKQNILVIDTKGNTEEFLAYDTLFLLTEKNITYLDERNSFQSLSLENTGPLTIDKQSVMAMAEGAGTFLNLRIVGPLIAGLSFIYLSILLPIGKIIYLIPFSVLTLIVARYLEIPLNYKQGYQIGMHLITITTLIFVLIWISGINLAQIPFLHTAFLISLVIIVLRRVKKSLADDNARMVASA